MHNRKLYGVTTVGTKGQVVIPSEAREALKLQPGDKLYVFGINDKNIVALVGEEQLRALVEHVTENIDNIRFALDGDKQ